MEQNLRRIDYRLLQGCCLEAEHADIVSVSMEGLRMTLPEAFGGTITTLVDEIRKSGMMLRDLADRSQMHFNRVPILLNYLEILLPCLSRTLDDINKFYEDRTVSKDMRWRKMYHKMTQEANGLPLPQRFMLYNQFLDCLRYLLMRSPLFDLNALESLRTRIIELGQSIRLSMPTTLIEPPLQPETMLGPMVQDPTLHWAEQIFSLPLTSRTALKHTRPSAAYGPFQAWGQLNIPKEIKMLFRRPFDEDRLALMTYLNQLNQTPYFLLRTYHLGAQWFSLRGTHELVIKREASSLQLDRWSVSQRAPKLWASLYFKTWEELVLFHCTFVSLKARNTLTINMNPREFKLLGEKRLFQAQIFDDGFKHALIVYRDLATQGLRLHASVWDGELRYCPVWTAFVTHQSASPTWLHRKSGHRVWLKDVQLYVFCEQYQQQHQRKGQAGAFEIDFVSEMGAKQFIDVFQPQSEPSEASTDGPDAIEDSK
ncbi:hypothetical protein CORC01_12385 [Colletotrichum orchidophilum]|uniref:Uncharacterized protein n=1 Tax=Colletotrichum orchidophilum TaxID=1209926 RepID=A0A1G4ATA7_9PEZI|nr:uncharacterized protein CORC01_12385 [Colletotrichum orchidophilum]OHE92323.1 hypothetical protein CORC01_12385 [Colletotrichum orchidophilum]